MGQSQETEPQLVNMLGFGLLQTLGSSAVYVSVCVCVCVCVEQ